MGVKNWLKGIFDDPIIQNPCKASAIINAGRSAGYTKREIKEARKALGIKSINKNGEQYWWLPEE